MHLGVRLTDDLRRALRVRATAAGISDSAMVRRLLLDVLGVESPLDHASPRVPPEEIQAAARLLDRLTALVLASRTLGDGQAGGAIQAMEAAHARLVAIIGRMER